MSKSNPECFGKITNTGRCPHCPYMEACRFASDDKKRIEAQNARWENAYEYDERIATPATELPVDVTPGRSFSHDEMVALSAFLLRIGSNKKLGRILEAKLMGTKSISQLARQEGVTRQAIDLSDKRVVIPMHGRAESLNAAVATGIFAYTWLRLA